ncbi:hypothetical protein A8B78_22265 [Jannaschia sp. EhC01]|nr:hypothetical protein A8B78_22265 [Jannaschia sp. EhC01]
MVISLATDQKIPSFVAFRCVAFVVEKNAPIKIKKVYFVFIWRKVCYSTDCIILNVIFTAFIKNWWVNSWVVGFIHVAVLIRDFRPSLKQRYNFGKQISCPRYRKGQIFVGVISLVTYARLSVAIRQQEGETSAYDQKCRYSKHFSASVSPSTP